MQEGGWLLSGKGNLETREKSTSLVLGSSTTFVGEEMDMHAAHTGIQVEVDFDLSGTVSVSKKTEHENGHLWKEFDGLFGETKADDATLHTWTIAVCARHWHHDASPFSQARQNKLDQSSEKVVHFIPLERHLDATRCPATQFPLLQVFPSANELDAIVRRVASLALCRS